MELLKHFKDFQMRRVFDSSWDKQNLRVTRGLFRKYEKDLTKLELFIKNHETDTKLCTITALWSVHFKMIPNSS
jgi:hypothetical protein